MYKSSGTIIAESDVSISDCTTIDIASYMLWKHMKLTTVSVVNHLGAYIQAQ